jgi:hypothetical protein
MNIDARRSYFQDLNWTSRIRRLSGGNSLLVPIVAFASFVPGCRAEAPSESEDESNLDSHDSEIGTGSDGTPTLDDDSSFADSSDASQDESVSLDETSSGSNDSTDAESNVWIRQWNGPRLEVAAVAFDSRGGVHVAGGSEDVFGQVARQTFDAILVEFGTDGIERSTLRFGGEGLEHPRALVFDSQGARTFAGEVIGEFGSDDFGSYDAFVVKVDEQGKQLWSVRLGTPVWDGFVALAADFNDSVFALGQTKGALAAESLGDNDLYLVKMDTNGQIIWQKQWGTEGREFAKGIAVDRTGCAIVVGEFGGRFGDGEESGDYFATKIDPDGNMAWTRQWNAGDYADVAAVAVDSNDRVFVVGEASDSVFESEPPFDGRNGLALAFDADGDVLWCRQWGTELSEKVFAIAIDDDDILHIAGETEGDLSEPNHGTTDVFVTKMNTEGEILGTKLIGSSREEYPSSIDVDAEHNVVVGGTTKSSLDGDNPGGKMGFVAKFRIDENEMVMRE